MSWDEVLEKYESRKWRLRAILFNNIDRFSNIVGEYIASVKADRRKYNEMIVNEAINLLSETTGILWGGEWDEEKIAEKAGKMLERVLRRDARIFRRLIEECRFRNSSSGQAVTPMTTQ